MKHPIDIKEYLLSEIPSHPQDIVALAMSKYGITRMAISRHIAELIQQDKVFKSGSTRNARYYLTSDRNRHFEYKVTPTLTESEVWKNQISSIFNALSESFKIILHYGFTEIFNNAIDHAQASKITVNVAWNQDIITLTITDNGIGVFQRINKTFHFSDLRECLLHLTKGKLTTDPINHSGEGIFFTSRAFDTFNLIANNISYYRDNTIPDWAVSSIEYPKGTQIILTSSIHSQFKLTELFNRYAPEENDHAFSKTDILVDLSLLNEEHLISRSQAKRILLNLGAFNYITLDFSKITTVGQGFADEIFRVYKQKNPQVTIKYVNANDDVIFMIKRSIEANKG